MRQNDALDAIGKSNAEERGDVFTLFFVRRGMFDHFLRRSLASVNQREGFGKLNVGRVIGIGTVGDHVFTDVGDHLEFLRARTADGTAVGTNGAKYQTQTGKDAHIRIEHDFVGLTGFFGVAIKAVCVLHHEFAGAHDAETRTTFVTELRADLVEVDRKLTPTRDFLTRQIGDHFFACGLDHKVALMAVLET